MSARANARFCTLPFEAPSGGLTVNAAVPAPERPFADEQAYLMAEVLDESGATIDGYEATQCVIRGRDEAAIPLRWGDRSAAALQGRLIRLRFHLRSANLYAVYPAA